MKPRKVWPLLFRSFLLKYLSYLLLSKDVLFYRVGRVLFRAGTPPIWVVRQKFCTGGFGLIIDSKSKIQSTKWLWNSISFLILRQKVPDLPHPWKMWGGILWSISLISNETFGAAQKTSVSLWDCTLSTIFYNQASWKFKTQDLISAPSCCSFRCPNLAAKLNITWIMCLALFCSYAFSKMNG